MINVKYHECEYEEVFVTLLAEQGWTYTPGDELKERMITDAIYEQDLKAYLHHQYADKNLSDDDYQQIIANLRNVGGANDYLAARAAHKLILHDGYDYQPLDGSPSFKVSYIDFGTGPELGKTTLDNNIFRCVNQFEMVEGEENRRPDVILMVNGIPLCIIELKNPGDAEATISNAWSQICVRYRRDIPSMMKYAALAVISDGPNTRMGSQFTPEEYFYAWKKVENSDPNGAIGINEMMMLIKGALSPLRMLDILRDYVFFPDETLAQDETEIVCRYPQFFAARMLKDSIFKAMRNRGGNGKGGTYFGATGCGKTHTMLFLSRLLMCRYAEQLKNPTVVIIVDRSDLEDQSGKLFCNATSYLSDVNVRVFESREDLRAELRANEGGGLFVTTIQKFAEGDGLLSDRPNIICLSDEAHRTQVSMGSKMKVVTKDSKKKKKAENAEKYETPILVTSIKEEVNPVNQEEKIGAFFTETFAQQLHNALPKATFVGFTGTPIEETIQIFGAEVDRYTMEQAKNDGITVDITYQARLAKVYLNSEQAKLVEEYYKKCESEGATPEDVDKSKLEMSQMKTILGNPERLDRIAKDIVEHYENLRDQQPDLVQKAMVVMSDRHFAFQLYKRILALRPIWGEKRKALDESKFTPEQLDEMDATAAINIVCTRVKDEDTKEEWDTFGTEAHRKSLEELFKNDESNFQIAIVVDMWLTGFDVPCLKVLYNDKPLSKHTLIQTISRVNRRYKTKDCGLVVDYLGIRENMAAAMKKFNKEGIDIPDEENACSIFKNELSILCQLLEGIDFDKFFSSNALERLMFLHSATEYILQHSEKGTKSKPSFKTLFLGHEKRMSLAFNIVKNAIHEDGSPFVSEKESMWAQALQGIASYVSGVSDSQHSVHSMNRHVEQMVKEAIGCSSVEVLLQKNGGCENIYSKEFQEEVERTIPAYTRFELLVKLITREIKEYGKTNRSRAEDFEKLLQQIIEDYHNRYNSNEVASLTIDQISQMVKDRVNELSDKLQDLLQEMNDDKKSFEKLGISFEEKAFYDILVKIRDEKGFEYSDERCKDLAKKIKEKVDGSTVYADFLNNGSLKDDLCFKLSILLRQNGYPPKWNNETVDGVMAQVINYKGNHLTINTTAEVSVQSPVTKLYFDSDKDEPNMSLMAADSSDIAKLPEEARLEILHKSVITVIALEDFIGKKLFTRKEQWEAIYRSAVDNYLALEGDYAYFVTCLKRMNIADLPFPCTVELLEKNDVGVFQLPVEEWTVEQYHELNKTKSDKKYNDLLLVAERFKKIVLNHVPSAKVDVKATKESGGVNIQIQDLIVTNEFNASVGQVIGNVENLTSNK